MARGELIPCLGFTRPLTGPIFVQYQDATRNNTAPTGFKDDDGWFVQVHIQVAKAETGFRILVKPQRKRLANVALNDRSSSYRQNSIPIVRIKQIQELVQEAG